jgi:hypothetical protein
MRLYHDMIFKAIINLKQQLANQNFYLGSKSINKTQLFKKGIYYIQFKYKLLGGKRKS